MIHLTRRGLLGSAAAVVAAPAWAQASPLRLGVLTPLTGAGSFDGPRMLKAMQAVAAERATKTKQRAVRNVGLRNSSEHGRLPQPAAFASTPL